MVKLLKSLDKSSPEDRAWALEKLTEWRGVALNNVFIYKAGFVASPNLATKGKDKLSLDQKVLIAILVLVSLTIQIVIPVALTIRLDNPSGSCPKQAEFLAKVIGIALCVFFITLTVNLCKTKLTGLGFLKMFCSSQVALLGPYRFMLDIGLFANLFAMALAGVLQFKLFINNSTNPLAFILQSLAMQFILSPDEKLITGALKAWTKGRMAKIVAHETNLAAEGGKDEVASEEAPEGEQDLLDAAVNNQEILDKVAFLYNGESFFLFFTIFVGFVWTIALGICM